MTGRPPLLLCLALTALAAPAPALAATSGANGTHDPSRMIESEGKFYVFSTGGGSKSSPDGLVWTSGPRILNGIPASLGLPDDQGVWAPDVIYLGGQYYLYYSAASSTTKACAVGLLTSPTLNPSSPDYHWTDRGLVVANGNSDTYGAIDPAPILDADNNLWVVWGGGYTNAATAQSIWVTRLDNTTGLPSSADPAKPGHPLELGHKEGSYLHLHGGYYYLFWQTGGCCSGASSTYEMHVARAQTITGPYGTERVFYASTGSIHGPGHIGIYSACGVERFTYHYYPDTGGSVLGENELSWSADGWPVVGAQSTTPLTPCGQPGGGGGGGTAGASGGRGGAGGTAAPDGGGGIAGGSGGAPVGGGAGGAVGAAGAGGGAGSTTIGGAGGAASGSPGAGGIAGGISDGGAPVAGLADGGGCACRARGGRGLDGRAGLGLAAMAMSLAIAAARRRRRRQ